MADLPAGAEGYGGFWRRFFALICDSLIASALSYLAVAGLLQAGLELTSVALQLAFFLVPVLYFALMQASAAQATIGKRLLGLKVSTASGERASFARMLGRELAKIVSALSLCIGFLLAAFTDRKQALHDMIASSLVLRVGPARPVLGFLVVLGAFGLNVAVMMFMLGGAFAGVMQQAMLQMAMQQQSMQPQEVARPRAPRPAAPTPAASAPAPRAASAAANPAPLTGAVQADLALAFVGSWRNEDPQTRSITRVEVAADGADLRIHMWGKCHPSDCDWGEVKRPLRDGQTGVLSPTWTTSFKVDEQRMAVLPDGRLQVDGAVRFTDKSGRPNRTYTDRFVPAKTLAAATVPAPVEKKAPVMRPEKPQRATAAAAQPAPVPAPEAKAVPGPRFNDLMSAVLYGDAAAVQELLALGRWPDKPDRRGMTPLEAAVLRGDRASAELLLEAGAQPDEALGLARERRDDAMASLLERYAR